MITSELDAIVKVEPIWKTNKGFDPPSPSRVRVPVMLTELEKQ
jgi:hypothetical protein